MFESERTTTVSVALQEWDPADKVPRRKDFLSRAVAFDANLANSCLDWMVKASWQGRSRYCASSCAWSFQNEIKQESAMKCDSSLVHAPQHNNKQNLGLIAHSAGWAHGLNGQTIPWSLHPFGTTTIFDLQGYAWSGMPMAWQKFKTFEKWMTFWTSIQCVLTHQTRSSRTTTF